MNDIETAEQFIDRMDGSLELAAYRRVRIKHQKARDAAIAHEARVGMLKVVRGIVNMEAREMRIAAISGYTEHHGITPAELVLVKPEIKVVQTDDSMNYTKPVYSVECGGCYWCGIQWNVKYRDFRMYFKHDAEAIAAHLRATSNFPKEK